VVNYQGTFLGAGTLIVAADANSLITGEGGDVVDGWTLDLSGTTNVTSVNSSTTITLADGAQWINRGDMTTAGFGARAQETFINDGS